MPAADVTKYLQPRFATRLKVASRQTAKSLGKTDKVICESGEFLFSKRGNCVRRFEYLAGAAEYVSSYVMNVLPPGGCLSGNPI